MNLLRQDLQGNHTLCVKGVRNVLLNDWGLSLFLNFKSMNEQKKNLSFETDFDF